MKLTELLKKIIKKWYVLGLFVLIFMGLGYVWSNYIYHPVYTAKTTMLVHPRKHTGESVDADIKLMPTYQGIMLGNAVLTYVKHDLAENSDYKVNVEQLSQQIHSYTDSNTLLIHVSADTPSAKTAVAVANTVVKQFKNHANDTMKIGKITQLMKAKKKNVTVSSRETKKFILTGGLLGLVIGLLIILFRIQFLSIRKSRG